MTGSSMISSQTILPALVTRLGGGNIAVGALARLEEVVGGIEVMMQKKGIFGFNR